MSTHPVQFVPLFHLPSRYSSNQEEEMTKKSNTSGLSRRSFLQLSAAATFVAGSGSLLAGCAPASAPASAPGGSTAASGEQVTLRFITNHGEADIPFFQEVIDSFTSANPGIGIEYLDIAGEEFYDSINAQGVGQQLPDVWYTRTFDVPVYANAGWTTNLQPLIERDAAEVNIEDFWPAGLEQLRWNGDIYGLLYDFSTIGIYYNKQLFDQAGIAYPTDEWNWTDLVNLGLQFTEQDANGQFTKWGLQLYTWSWVFLGVLLGWGGKVFNDDFTECIIDSPENREAFNFFIDARKQGLYPEAGAAPAGVDPFVAGMVPMSFQGSWATTYMRSTIGDAFDFDVVKMPLSPSGQSCVTAAGGGWGIASNTQHLEEAWLFLKHLASTESQNVLISQPLRSIPGRQSAAETWNEVAAEGNLPPANVTAFADQTANAQSAPYPHFWRDYDIAWSNTITPMLDGVTDDGPEVVLPAFQTEINRIIAQAS